MESDDAEVGGPPLTALGSAIGGRARGKGGWARSLITREPTAEQFEAVEELFPVGAAARDYLFRFAALIVLSASIAAFGLIADSAAVVIGAMLVAPLMTPITAAAAATATARNDRLVRSILVIALGVVLAVAVGWAVGKIAAGGTVGPTQMPREIRSRTYPNLLDLGIAISAGAAAGYILPRRSATSALPGVGIAVALVPPLATVGITAEAGLRTEARNAMLLFLTNLAAIVFAATVALLLTGFRPGRDAGKRALSLRIALTVLAVIAVTVPLAVHTASILRENSLRSAVTAAVSSWDPTVRILDLDVSISGDVGNIDLLVAGQDPTQRAWRLAEEIRDRFGQPVELRMQYQEDQLFIVSVR
ncbi:MAG: DUF389 domain-containing protein [Ilumatobacteraceae bacterium]